MASAHFLTLALYAFAVVGWELVLLLVEPWLVRPSIAPLLDASGLPGALSAAVLHWGLTGAGWLVGGVLLLRFAHRHYAFGYEARAAAVRRTRRTIFRWTAAVALVVACVAARSIALGGTPKPIAEFTAFVREFGDSAWIAMSAQYGYYLAEAFVMVLIIAFGQRAGQRRFGFIAVPWGGLVLAFTWGAMHVLLQGVSGGTYAMAAALAYGGIYVLCGRRMSLAVPLIAVAFVL